jgi:hypothetical protein
MRGSVVGMPDDLSTGGWLYCNGILLLQTELFKGIFICCYGTAGRIASHFKEYSTDCL